MFGAMPYSHSNIGATRRRARPMTDRDVVIERRVSNHSVFTGNISKSFSVRRRFQHQYLFILAAVAPPLDDDTFSNGLHTLTHDRVSCDDRK